MVVRRTWAAEGGGRLAVPRAAGTGTARGIRAAGVGLVINSGLAGIKLVAGLLGNSYALVADAVESLADVFTSLIVFGALRVSAREADDAFPFGYDKAQSLAAAVVGLTLVAAAVGIAIEAVREILTPHRTPAPFTLAVLLGVIVVKEALFRRVHRVGLDLDLGVVQADAWHHRSDAITSAAAFAGITVALIGGEGWAPADDFAALFATTIIAFNGLRVLRPAIGELMDRAPDTEIIAQVTEAAKSVGGVLAIEKLRIRRAGARCLADLHVQADPVLSLHEAHILSGKVKSAIWDAAPRVEEVLVHMEPFEP